MAVYSIRRVIHSIGICCPRKNNLFKIPFLVGQPSRVDALSDIYRSHMLPEHLGPKSEQDLAVGQAKARSHLAWCPCVLARDKADGCSYFFP